MDGNGGVTADSSPKDTLNTHEGNIENGQCQNIEKTATATKPNQESIVSDGTSEGSCCEGRPPGIVKAKLEKRLSKLLTTFAVKNTPYSGLDMSPSSPAGQNLPSLPPSKGTPDSQPPSLYFGT